MSFFVEQPTFRDNFSSYIRRLKNVYCFFYIFQNINQVEKISNISNENSSKALSISNCLRALKHVNIKIIENVSNVEFEKSFEFYLTPKMIPSTTHMFFLE
jgi:hypothetical protein